MYEVSTKRVWGLGYRFTSDGYVSLKQASVINMGLNLFIAFLIDESMLLENNL
ncbi:MAG: hypothetical protein SCALA701_27900 [Candidatus Scalindua sp.]|nr:MAG: hypothetical protein SCALA701_27900 [Candidatus Scalindua sp.]